ncbi:hypothetical protein HDZ31DRAFT_26206, partial [Schizophyllum fasciatum]
LIRPETCFDSLCSNLDLPDLVHLSRVNAQSLQKVKMYSQIAFHPHRILRTFIRAACVEELLDIMRHTGTIISGRAALLFFTRDVLDDCELNLYTERHHAEAIFDFVGTQGYAYCARDDQDENQVRALRNASSAKIDADGDNCVSATVIDTFNFVRPSLHDTADTVIQVTVARFCAVHTVLSFHTTALMNIVTHRAAYSLYPRATFVHKVGILLRSTKNQDSAVTQLHHDWTLRTSLTNLDLSNRAIGSEFATYWRYIGDSQTWTINFTSLDAPHERLSEPDSVLFNSWSLEWRNKNGILSRPRIETHVYMGNASWIQSRVFASVNLAAAFAN